MYNTKTTSEKLKANGLEYSANDVSTLARLGVFKDAARNSNGNWLIPEESINDFIKIISQENKSLNKNKQRKLRIGGWITTGTVIAIVSLLLALISSTKDGLDLIIEYGARFRGETSACSTILGINLDSEQPQGNDEEQISSLLNREANAILFFDPQAAVKLYREDSLIRELSGPAWSGCVALKDRYELLQTNLTFTKLTHKIDELTITHNQAIAIVSTKATYFFGSHVGVYDQYANKWGPQNYEAKEVWTFVKSSDDWYIKSLVYEGELVVKPGN